MSSRRKQPRFVHTEDNRTWLVQVAQEENGFWYVVDQTRTFEAPLRYVGPFESRGDALDVAYDRYASPLERAQFHP